MAQAFYSRSDQLVVILDLLLVSLFVNFIAVQHQRVETTKRDRFSKKKREVLS